MKKTLFTLLRIAVTAGILLFIFSKLEISKSFSIILSSNITDLIFAAIFMLILSFIISLRWHQILKVYGLSISLFKAFRIYMIAFFFNNFLPSTVGMDFIRGAYVDTDKKKIADVISTIILERWIGLLGIIIYVTIIPLIFFRIIDVQYFYYVSGGGGLISIIFVIAIWNERVYSILSRFIAKITWLHLGEKANNLYSSLRTMRKHPQMFFTNLILSISIQLLFVLANYFIVRSQMLDITFLDLLIYVPLISIISMIPVTINGIGLRDWAYITFFGIGMKEQAFSLSITFFILITLVSLIGGIMFIFEKKQIKEKK